uniref:Uncharacterized protein n=1 Tax=Cacopsylla melanoneura TaxID=428564 RepID=A0A8D9B5T1_9HEMI
MEINCRRPKGRPRYRYNDMIKIDIDRKQGQWEDIENSKEFENRLWWRTFVHRPIPLGGTRLVMYLQGNGRNGHHVNRVLKYSMRATDAGWTLDSFFSMNGNNLIQTVCPLHEDDSITADIEQDSM